MKHIADSRKPAVRGSVPVDPAVKRTIQAGNDVEERGLAAARGAQDGMLDHVQELCRNEGLAVLWATPLVDAVLPEAQVVILHKGQVLAEGAHEALLAETGAVDIHDAFTQLTRNADQAAEGADVA